MTSESKAAIYVFPSCPPFPKKAANHQLATLEIAKANAKSGPAESAHLRTKRERCENDGVDESAKLFQAEQKRLADVGGPIRSLKRQITDGIIALGAFATIVWVLVEGLSSLPRNPDNSIKLIYFGPVLITLSAIAALFLRTDITKHRPLRVVAWSVIALAVIAILAGVVDSLARIGG